MVEQAPSNAVGQNGQQGRNGVVAVKTYFGQTTTEPWTNLKKIMHQRSDLVLIIRRDGFPEERIPIMSEFLAIKSIGMALAFDALGSTENELVIEGCRPNVVQQFINFAFMGNFGKSSTDEDLLELIDFDRRFFTHGLLKKCLAILKRRLKVKNCIKILRRGSQYEIEDLKETALNFIYRNTKDVFNSGDFLTLTVEELKELLEKDELHCSEVDLYSAVIKWGQCKLQYSNNVNFELTLFQMLRPLIHLIRFPLMSASDFASLDTKSAVLTNEEIITLFQCICGNSSDSSFLSKPRNFRAEEMNVSNELRPIEIGIPSLNISSNEQFSTKPGSSIYERITTQFFQNISNSSTTENPSIANSQRNSRVCQKEKKLLQSGSVSDNDLDQTNETTENAVSKIYEKKGCVFNHWEEFIEQFADNAQSVLRETTAVILTAAFKTVHLYPTVIGPRLDTIKLDLKIDIGSGEDLDYESLRILRRRFEQTFDIRRYLICRPTDAEDVQICRDLWSRKIDIDIKINGITMLKMNHSTKELVIGFRNDSEEILSGLSPGEQLTKLCLMKTDVPVFANFPCKSLKHVLFYHLWALSETDAGDFIRRCSKLENFSCWIICPYWENSNNSKSSLHRPTVLHLGRDFVSGSSLRHLALCKVVLDMTRTIIMKEGLTELFLDGCFWPDYFPDIFHKIFPNLVKCSLVHRPNENINASLHPNFKSIVNIKMLYNLTNLRYIRWVRINGVDWNHNTEDNKEKPASKHLRSNITPVSDMELATVESIFVSCNLKKPTNFILMKRKGINETEATETLKWSGTNLDEKELKEFDNGYHDFMDYLDFTHYELQEFFKNYKVLQTEVDYNLQLP